MRKKMTCLALAVLMAVSVTACQDNKENSAPVSSTQAEPSLQLTEEELPIIDGALALAPYYEAMTAKLLGIDIEEARKLGFNFDSRNFG